MSTRTNFRVLFYPNICPCCALINWNMCWYSSSKLSSMSYILKSPIWGSHPYQIIAIPGQILLCTKTETSSRWLVYPCDSMWHLQWYKPVTKVSFLCVHCAPYIESSCIRAACVLIQRLPEGVWELGHTATRHHTPGMGKGNWLTPGPRSLSSLLEQLFRTKFQ